MRLFFGVADVASRLMQISCVPGSPDATSEAAASGRNAQKPAQRAADQQPYKLRCAISK